MQSAGWFLLTAVVWHCAALPASPFVCQKHVCACSPSFLLRSLAPLSPPASGLQPPWPQGELCSREAAHSASFFFLYKIDVKLIGGCGVELLWWLSWKESACQCRRHKRHGFHPYLGGEDPLEEEMATTPAFLPGKSPWTEEPGGLQSLGSQSVGHDLLTEQQEEVICGGVPQRWLC